MATPLSCPFCGETPRIDPDDYRAEGDAWAGVMCDNDECEVQPGFRNYANIAAFGKKGSLRQKKLAVAKWNKLLRLHSTRTCSE